MEAESERRRDNQITREGNEGAHRTHCSMPVHISLISLTMARTCLLPRACD